MAKFLFVKLSNEVKVAIFVLATLVIVFLGYNFLNSSEIFSSSQKFYAFYKNIDGLGVANEVQLNGFKVGKVQSIQIVPEKNNQILVRFEIDKKIKIYKSTVFKINSIPLSNTVVSLVFDTQNNIATSGDTLQGESGTSILSQFNDQISPIKKRAETVMQSIDTILDQINVMMTKNGNNNLKSTMSDVQSTVHNLKETTDHLNGLMKNSSDRLASIIKNMDEISTNLKNNNAVIGSALKNIDKISDDVAKSNLKQTIENTNKTIADLSVVMSKIKNGEGSMGLLINDDKLYLNLKNSSANLDKLIVDLKENPSRYVHFSLFGKKAK